MSKINKKLAICVPYRNREKHLQKFIPHMDDFFKDKGIEYKIFICNQADDKKFSRGKTKNVACFNGKNSFIEIPLNESLKEMQEGDHTISFLIKPENRSDMKPYLFGNPNSEYVNIPILSQYGLSNLTYGNTKSYIVSFWNNQNKGINLWVKREENLWTVLTYNVNMKEKSVTVFVNGKDVDHKNKINYKYKNKNYYNTPLFIGFRDGPVWTEDLHNYFKGQIAEVGMWSSALSDDVIKELTDKGLSEIKNEDLVLHYDFEKTDSNLIYDVSGNENHGKMTNCNIENTDIGQLLDLELPYRMYSKYYCFSHEDEGIQNDNYKHVDGAVNEEILEIQVIKGKVDTNKNGLNNLTYNVLSQNVIFNKHVMINVEC